MNHSVTNLSAEGLLFTTTEGNGLSTSDPFDIPSLLPASETLPREPTLHECLTGLKAQWADMRPAARWTFIGSSIVSAAALGYITIRLGPIPSIRRTVRALPDLARADNVRWIRGQAARVLPKMDRAVQHHNAYARLSAGALATTLALTNAYPVQQTPPEPLAITHYATPQDNPIIVSSPDCQQH